MIEQSLERGWPTIPHPHQPVVFSATARAVHGLPGGVDLRVWSHGQQLQTLALVDI